MPAICWAREFGNRQLQDSVVATVAQFSSYAWWVADDYKVTSRLTVNLGLRHDIMLPYTEAGDNFTFLDPTAPNPAAGGRTGSLAVRR